jgi:hypothetical protein
MKVSIPIETAAVIFPAAYDLANMPRKKKKKMKKEFNKVLHQHLGEWLENNESYYEKLQSNTNN